MSSCNCNCNCNYKVRKRDKTNKTNNSANILYAYQNKLGNTLLKLDNGTNVNLGNLQGPKGNDGLPGTQGARGEQGPAGEQGIIIGKPGEIGNKGPTGLRGGAGDIGPRGPRGTVHPIGQLVDKPAIRKYIVCYDPAKNEIFYDSHYPITHTK